MSKLIPLLAMFHLSCFASEGTPDLSVQQWSCAQEAHADVLTKLQPYWSNVHWKLAEVWGCELKPNPEVILDTPPTPPIDSPLFDKPCLAPPE